MSETRTSERQVVLRTHSLVKRFGGIAATNDVSLHGANAARATR